MKAIRQRRRFYPYASRKNMKRAKGIKQHGFAAPRSEGLGGMGAQLLGALLGKAKRPEQASASRGK
jgi:hypothetical protein